MLLPQSPNAGASRFSSEVRQTQIVETVIALAAKHGAGQITMQEIAN